MSDFAQTVKQQADIVKVIEGYIRLRKAGAQNYTGLCPFHKEKSPSFSVHAVRQFYHCFGCQASGDVFSFVGKIENVGFPEAVRIVAQKCGIPLPKREFSSPEAGRRSPPARQAPGPARNRNRLVRRAVARPRRRRRPRIPGRPRPHSRGHQDLPHRLRARQLQRPARPPQRHGRQRNPPRLRPVQLQGAGRRHASAPSTTASASASCFPSPTRAAA